MKMNKIITLSILSLLPTILQAADYDASLNWARRVEIGFAVSGTVSKVNVSSGSIVKKGDALVELDARIFDARKSEARATFNSKNEDLIEANRELDRAMELFDRTVLSEHDLQMAKNGKTRATAEYKQAQTALVKANVDKDNSVLKAPYNAVVIRTMSEVGQNIRADLQSPVMVILGEAGKMIATAQLSAEQINGLQNGKSAKVTVDGKDYDGKVKSIAFEPVNGSYPVEVEFETGSKQLRAGIKASIRL